jgi:hypothetical protein
VSRKNLLETKIFVFEQLVGELSQQKPDKRRVVDSCKHLGLPTDLELTDLMQLLLEKYPDFLSDAANAEKPQVLGKRREKSTALNS